MRMSALREPTFLLLTALASGPLHGYAAIKEVAALSDDRVKLRAGTLYAALDRLTGEGLVMLDREEVVDGRLRRYYRLTDNGAALLAKEAEQLRRNASAAAERLRRRSGARPATGAV
jgi:DNA-binding PadR family transcriptional regulator